MGAPAHCAGAAPGADPSSSSSPQGQQVLGRHRRRNQLQRTTSGRLGRPRRRLADRARPKPPCSRAPASRGRTAAVPRASVYDLRGDHRLVVADRRDDQRYPVRKGLADGVVPAVADHSRRARQQVQHGKVRSGDHTGGFRCGADPQWVGDDSLHPLSQQLERSLARAKEPSAHAAVDRPRVTTTTGRPSSRCTGTAARCGARKPAPGRRSGSPSRSRAGGQRLGGERDHQVRGQLKIPWGESARRARGVPSIRPESRPSSQARTFGVSLNESRSGAEVVADVAYGTPNRPPRAGAGPGPACPRPPLRPCSAPGVRDGLRHWRRPAARESSPRGTGPRRTPAAPPPAGWREPPPRARADGGLSPASDQIMAGSPHQTTECPPLSGVAPPRPAGVTWPVSGGTTNRKRLIPSWPAASDGRLPPCRVVRCCSNTQSISRVRTSR